MWNFKGTPAQNALAQRAINLSSFPYEVMAPSLKLEGRSAIDAEWADLSQRGARAAGAAGHEHDEHEQEHAEGVHSIVREVDGRRRVLGLFYLPPHTKIVLDVSLEQNPALAIEVFLAEAAHAVDYHWMVPKGMRRAVWNALHSIPGTAGGEIPESGDIDHGHSWFDGAAGYNTWAGEAFMEAFIEAFAPSVPVTIQLDHPVTPDMAVLIRTALLAPLAPPPPPEPPRDPSARVYSGKYRTYVYHDTHKRIEPVVWYEDAAAAEAAGLRACRTCKPAGGTRAFEDDDLLDGCGAGDDVRGLEDSEEIDPELLCLFPPDLVGPPEWLAEQWRTLFPSDGPPMPHARGVYDVCKVIDSEGEVQPTVAELMSTTEGARAALGRDLGLLDRLRAEGLNVPEVAGWRTRGSSTYNPHPHLCHHTGGAGSALRVIIEGRSDLSGPLSQTNSHRDLRVFLVASGRANHAGPGGHLGYSGNTSCSGDEADHTGSKSEGWSPERRLVRAKVANAQIKGRGRGPEFVVRHAKWATPAGRKPDVVIVGPEDTDEGIRATVRQLRSTNPPPTPNPTPEFDMPFKPQPDAFHIGPVHSGLVWDLPFGGRRGDPVITARSDGGPDQRWRRVTHPDGTVSLLTRDGTLALDCPQPWAKNSPVTVWDPHGGLEQRFRLEDVPDNPYTYLVRHVGSGFYVAPLGGGHGDAPLVLWDVVDGLWFRHRFTHTI